MKGFVLLYRSITRDEIWTSEPAMNRAMAFIDLLLLASHNARTIKIRNTKIHVEPGDVPYSTRFLAKRWKTSRFFVEKFLKYLSQKGSVIIIQGANTPVIRLVNWGKYQKQPLRKTTPLKPDLLKDDNFKPPVCLSSQPPETGISRPPESLQNELKTNNIGAPGNNLQPPETQNPSHNQQCINTINNYIKENIQSPDESGLCALLLQKMTENYAPRRIPQFIKWQKEISNMINEGIPFEKILRVIEFSQNTDFWKSRIRSASSLNFNFETLAMQMTDAEKKNQNLQTNSPRILL
ncbi:MAG: hypothetical protein ACM3P0_16495 [Acidobacteriota bacterium]